MGDIEKGQKKAKKGPHRWGPDDPAPRFKSPGRGKGNLSLTTILRKALKHVDSETKKKEALLVIEGMLESAKKGHAKSLEIIWDRIEGKLADKHEVGGPGGGPIVTQKNPEEVALVKEFTEWRIKKLLEEGKE